MGAPWHWPNSFEQSGWCDVVKGIAALATLAFVALFSGAYILIAVLRIDPAKETYTVTVDMDRTSGLMNTSAVTLFGVEVGRVTSILARPEGIRVQVALDEGHRIPSSTRVAVRNLSAAGEQYLDLRPERSEGPYLKAGSLIPAAQVTPIATAGDVTEKVDRLGELIDPAAVRRLGDLAVTLGTDQATLANMNVIVGLLASTLHDRAGNIGGLYRGGQLIESRLMGIDAPEIIRQAGPNLSRLGPSLSEVLTQVGALGAMEQRDGPFNKTAGPSVVKLMAELNTFLPSVGGLAAALTPVTGQLRGIRVNAGAFTDMWGKAFPVGGPARVALTVK